MERLLTPLQVSLTLGVCLKTVYNMLNSGTLQPRRIPGIRAVRVHPDDLTKLIEDSACQSRLTKGAATKSSLAKGDAEYIEFCQKEPRGRKQSGRKTTSGEKSLEPTS